MIRLILVLLFVVLYLILTLPVLGILWLIRRKHPKEADLASLRMVQWAFRVILFLAGTKLTVIGEENVPKDQPVLYIGNHRSYFDIVITYARCPRLTGYVAKSEMLKVPLLRTWMKRLYCLFLDRSDIKQGLQTILTGIAQIKDGVSMCIFPEGTRNTNASELDLLPFHEGSLKMAEKTGCPIIPMAISNSAQVLEAHMPWIRSCHVTLEYGKPIYPKELSREEKKFLGAHCQTQILEMLKKNQAS